MTGLRAARDPVDVLVVGAGHHGLATAVGLARAGCTVEVVDSGRHPALPWTAVHHWSVLSDLHHLGVLDDLVAAGARATGWGLRVLATGEHITYDLGDLVGQVEHPYHLRVAEDRLREVLQRRLLELGGTTARPGRVVGLHQHPGGVTVDLDTPSGPHLARARWVVAADGAASAVRREAGIAFEGTTWWERCVVALVRHDFAALGYPDTTFQVDGSHGAVVERAGEDTWRYVFQEPGTRPEDTVASRIPDVLRHATGGAREVVEWTAERMHQRVAAQFRTGRVLLVGEAAHVTHRLIGHSSISGWFDAFSLARLLPEVVTERADDEALTAWAQQRRRVYLDDAVPASLSRKNLVSGIRDRASLDVELDQFRRALSDASLRREVLLQGRELDGALLAGPTML
jgi:3-(3-hydroxy-phenyl)propionate hydroxylase